MKAVPGQVSSDGGCPTADLRNTRFGYVPGDPTLLAPGDRRRFVAYAQARGIRLELVRRGGEYDVVVIAASGDFSSWIEYPRGRAKLVFDFVDSYLAMPRFEPKALLRGLAKYAAGQNRRFLPDYRRGLQQMCSRADAVVCSTQEQEAAIRLSCENVHCILDFQDQLVRTRKTDFATDETFHFAWEGLAGNLRFFAGIRETLRKIGAKRPLAIHAVTNLEYGQYLKGRVWKRRALDLARRVADNIFLYAWNEHTLSALLTACDLALVPVPLDDAINTGKPENKLLLFWRMGIPAVVSATPAYQRAMAGAGLPMCCRDQKDWEEVLERYMNDESLRAEASRRGARFVEEHYSEGRLLAQWDEVFSSVLEGGE